MAENEGQEKTEQATAKRREDFRKKGQVAQSKEVTTAALMTTTLLLWLFYGPIFWENLQGLLHGLIGQIGTFSLTPLSVHSLFLFVLGKISLMLAPVLLLVLVVGFFSTFLQIGWLFTGKPLEPDLAKLNPIQGMSKFVSKRSAMEVVKSLAKVFVIGFIAYKTLEGNFEESLYLVDMPPVKTVSYFARTTFALFAKTCGVLILLGLIDFLFVRYEMEEKMKMSKQEVKEEHKESEGDPMLKGRIRQIQAEMSRKRMMAEVPKADVIITNPTHLSVAIAYRREEMAAPMIVAKGADEVAMRIREIAREHDVPLVENVPVARALFPLELDSEVPEELFKAVAEILAYVYSLKGKK